MTIRLIGRPDESGASECTIARRSRTTQPEETHRRYTSRDFRKQIMQAGETPRSILPNKEHMGVF